MMQHFEACLIRSAGNWQTQQHLEYVMFIFILFYSPRDSFRCLFFFFSPKDLFSELIYLLELLLFEFGVCVILNCSLIMC